MDRIAVADRTFGSLLTAALVLTVLFGSGCDSLSALVDGKSCSSDAECFVGEVCTPKGRCEDARTVREHREGQDRHRAWEKAKTDRLSLTIRGGANASSHRVTFWPDGTVSYVCTHRCPQHVWRTGRAPAGGLAALDQTLRARGFLAIPHNPVKLAPGARTTEVTLRAGDLEQQVVFDQLTGDLAWLDTWAMETLKAIRWQGQPPSLLRDSGLSDRELEQAESIRRRIAELRVKVGHRCKGGPVPVWGSETPDSHGGIMMLITTGDKGRVATATLASASPSAAERCTVNLIRGTKVGKFSAMPGTLEIPLKR